MRIFHGSKQAHGKIKRPVFSMGNFDGVHLAHQKMFELTRALARKYEGTPCVYTFEPHPVKLLSPASSPSLINTLEQKIERIKASKIEALILEPFTKDFAHLAPLDFFNQILLDRLHPAALVVGYDFTFGTKRSGTVETLEQLCQVNRLPYQILEAFLVGDTLASSTQIRQLVQQGDVSAAAQLLGSPFELIGKVVRGEGVGKTLGYPTANIKFENELIPETGVYATQIQIGKRTYSSITNIGNRPTFKGKQLTVETHVFHFRQSIYHHKVRLKFIRKIRNERRFDSPQDLIHQIHKDIEEAKESFKK